MTRAKSNLFIHTNTDLFAKYVLPDVIHVTDSNDYSEPSEIVLQTTHRDVVLDYFKNKKDIFLWSIKQLTSDIEKELLSIIKNPELTASDCLKQILFKLFDIAENNQVFFKVLLNYLVQLEKSGADVNERVTRRVIRIQHLMNTVIIRGQKAGQLKHFSVKDINDQLYMIIEDAMFRLGVLNQKSLDQSRSIAEFTVNQIKA